MRQIIYLLALLFLTLDADAQKKSKNQLEKDFGISNLKLKPNSIINPELQYIVGGTHKPFENYNKRVRKRLFKSIVPLTERYSIYGKSEYFDKPQYVIEYEVNPEDFEYILFNRFMKPYGSSFNCGSERSAAIISCWGSQSVTIETLRYETIKTRIIKVRLDLSNVKNLKQKLNI